MITLLTLLGCPAAEPTLDERLESFLTEEALTPADCGTVTYALDCDADGEAAVACLSDAWAACTPARLEELRYTEEGDPIVTVYVVFPGDSCRVEVFLDTTADNFGSQFVTQSTCEALSFTPAEGECDQIAYDACSPA